MQNDHQAPGAAAAAAAGLPPDLPTELQAILSAEQQAGNRIERMIQHFDRCEITLALGFHDFYAGTLRMPWIDYWEERCWLPDADDAELAEGRKHEADLYASGRHWLRAPVAPGREALSLYCSARDRRRLLPERDWARGAAKRYGSRKSGIGREPAWGLAIALSVIAAGIVFYDLPMPHQTGTPGGPAGPFLIGSGVLLFLILTIERIRNRPRRKNPARPSLSAP